MHEAQYFLKSDSKINKTQNIQNIIYNTSSVINSLLDLRDISSLGRDNFKLNEQPIKFEKLLQEMVEMHKMNDDQDVSISLKGPTLGPLTLLGDGPRIT